MTKEDGIYPPRKEFHGILDLSDLNTFLSPRINLKSGLFLRVKFDPTMLGSYMRYDIEKYAISMGPISRQDIECSTNPKGDLERLVKLATRHEYHHAVFDANVKKDPKLPEKILSVVDSEEKLKASWNLFARYMFDSPIYRLTLFDKNGNQNRLGILHEIFAYAGEFKYSVPGNPHENFIGVAYRFLNTMESCNPELLNYLKYLDIVDNTTFDEDYPEIRKVLSTMAKKFSGFGPIQSFGRA